MKPDTFVFLVSIVLLILLIQILFNKKPLSNGLHIFIFVYIVMVFIFQYAIVSGKKVLLEIPHLWMNLTVIFTSLFINDTRILNFNIILLLITVLSRLYYNGCAINMAGYKEKQIMPKFLTFLQREIKRKTNIDWTHIYGFFLLINIYKVYVI
jgi:hypothetical protein